MSKILKIVSTVLVVLLLSGATVSAVYFYFQYQKAQNDIKVIKTDSTNSQKAAQDEAKALVETVGKIIELPSGEEPTVATVTDAAKLREQSLFQKAQNGDKVLVYINAKKAFLYRPSTNKIIDLGPVKDLNQEQTATSSAKPKSAT